MISRLSMLALFAVLLVSACSQNESTEQRPNILFVMTDDHAFQAISAYGSNLIDTPNIDRLAEEGMLFERAFVSNSICSPSRAAIITGKHSHLNSVRNNRDVFDSTQVTLPKLLREAGYHTAVVGKWHLKSQPTGFDYWKVLPGQGYYYQPEFRTPEGVVTEEGYVTDVITDLAIGYLDSLRDESKPFMLMYQHKAPHREWWPSMQDLEEFKDREIPQPETLFDDYENRGTAAKEAEMRIYDHMGLTNDNKIRPEIVERLDYEEFLGWYEYAYTSNYDRLTEEEKEKWNEVYGPINEEFEENTPKGQALTLWKYQRYMEDYLGTIRSVDRNLGRIMEYLEQNGLAENTMIIYTSDQGFYLGEHGWFDKRFMYEESFRTPLIIKYPGVIEPGSRNRELVQNIDFAPTMLEAARTEIPDDIQGRSLVPLFENNREEWRDGLYYHYYEYPGIHMVKRHYGIRTDRYKLIHFYYDVDEWELYDLQEDPMELNNLYDNPEYAEVQQRLHNELEELRDYYGDSKELDQMFLEKDLGGEE